MTPCYQPQQKSQQARSGYQKVATEVVYNKHMKTYLVPTLICIALFIPTYTQAFTLSEFVELLIALEVIEPTKIQVARDFVESQQVATTRPPQAGAGATYCAPTGTTFGIGTENSEVTKLQTFLKQTGDFTYSQITGYYGNVTAEAVQRYQCREMNICNGTMAENGYGLAGPGTRREMCTNTENSLQPTVDSTTTQGTVTLTLTSDLYKGTKGEDVKQLQTFLKTTGDYTYPEITGYYGTQTELAVQRYQKRNNIVSSGTPTTTGYGNVGPSTRASITRTNIPTPTIPVGVGSTGGGGGDSGSSGGGGSTPTSQPTPDPTPTTPDTPKSTDPDQDSPSSTLCVIGEGIIGGCFIQ
jgi:peptidoglycan hydrolase-like protein with peptidoglycan-binding domain